VDFVVQHRPVGMLYGINRSWHADGPLPAIVYRPRWHSGLQTSTRAVKPPKKQRHPKVPL
jgi:hypothetical protein